MTSINNIPTNEELHKIFMNSDIKRWKEEIEIINVEMIFYKNLLNTHLKEYASWSDIDYESLFRGIADVQYYNVLYQKNLLDFNNRLYGMAECDDLQCENYYLNNHARIKNEIETHFSTYKVFKKTLFSYLKTRYNY